MILVFCAAGHVASAAREAALAIRERATFGDPARDDPFRQARGCRAIVYGPEPRLLDFAVADPSADRSWDVLRAARAHGVARVVVVQAAVSPRQEERLPRNEPIAITVVRCAALLDELADATNLHIFRSVWLPRGREVELATRSALATTIRLALFRDDLRGATVFVPTVRMDIVEAMRRAAAIAGADVRVRGTSPSVSSAMRRLHGWLNGQPPIDVEALCNRLGSSPRSGARRPNRAGAHGGALPRIALTDGAAGGGRC